jgi:hypothetical protein
VALALLALGALWFFSRFELVPAKEWVGPGREARRDPFLAAGRFAGRMGLRTRQIRALPELDKLPADGVLLLPSRRQAIDPRRLRGLVAWAEAGGHLLVEAELPGVSDPLLDYLGVQRRSAGEREFKPPPVQTARGRTLKVSLPARTLLRLPEAAEVAFSAGGRDTTVIASLETGRGMVTVTGSLAFARNGFIGTDDNAEFLWYLLDLTPARELHVFLRQERLSLCSRYGCGASARASARWRRTCHPRAGGCSTTCGRAAATTGRRGCARAWCSPRATQRCATWRTCTPTSRMPRRRSGRSTCLR